MTIKRGFNRPFSWIFLCITSRVKTTVIQIRAGHALSGYVRSHRTGLGGN